MAAVYDKGGRAATFVELLRYWKYASGLLLMVLAYAGRESLQWSREGLKAGKRCPNPLTDAWVLDAVHGQVLGPQTVRKGPPLPQQPLVNEAMTHLIHLD